MTENMDNVPTIVAFTGKRGSGKSTAARIFIDALGFRELKFADPLKRMLRALYNAGGVDADTIERKIEGDLKEEPCDILMGKTPRYAMQTLGTEWRDMIDCRLWSNMFQHAVESGKYGNDIVCSDCRFPHEVDVLRSMGATIIRIERQEADSVEDAYSAHVSEKYVDEMGADFVIQNDGTFEDLELEVLATAFHLKR